MKSIIGKIDLFSVVAAILVGAFLLWIVGSCIQYSFCGYTEIGSLGWLIKEYFL